MLTIVAYSRTEVPSKTSVVVPECFGAVEFTAHLFNRKLTCFPEQPPLSWKYSTIYPCCTCLLSLENDSIYRSSSKLDFVLLRLAGLSTSSFEINCAAFTLSVWSLSSKSRPSTNTRLTLACMCKSCGSWFPRSNPIDLFTETHVGFRTEG